MKYSLKHHLLKESPHDQKLAKLLTSPVSQAVQGAQLGEPLDLVRGFDHFPMPFDENHIVQVTTPPSLAQAIKEQLPVDLTQRVREDGWVESSYVIAEK